MTYVYIIIYLYIQTYTNIYFNIKTNEIYFFHGTEDQTKVFKDVPIPHI
jgi:hypothetical protein